MRPTYSYECASGSNYEYFGGKLLKNAQGWVNQDRLGSVGKFFPYGQERSATANGTEKFATYFRDAETGLDYAQNRYHSAGDGRFLTPDPAGSSAMLKVPGTWNRYAYSGSDPVNHSDPSGQWYICAYVNNELDGCFEDGDGGMIEQCSRNPLACLDPCLMTTACLGPPSGSAVEGQNGTGGAGGALTTSDISNNVIVDQLLTTVDKPFSEACATAVGKITGAFPGPTRRKYRYSYSVDRRHQTNGSFRYRG